MQVNIHEAKSTLSKLVARIEDEGIDVTLCRAGRPAAKISPLPAKKSKKGIEFGLLAGKIEISDGFYSQNAQSSAIFGILEGK